MAKDWALNSKDFDPIKAYEEKLTNTVKSQGFEFLEKYDPEMILFKKTVKDTEVVFHLKMVYLLEM